MSFAPRPVVKNFKRLSLFHHDIEPMLAQGGAVATLRRGRTVGGRVQVQGKRKKIPTFTFTLTHGRPCALGI
jgi:hypothetical protein